MALSCREPEVNSQQPHWACSRSRVSSAFSGQLCGYLYSHKCIRTETHAWTWFYFFKLYIRPQCTGSGICWALEGIRGCRHYRSNYRCNSLQEHHADSLLAWSTNSVLWSQGINPWHDPSTPPGLCILRWLGAPSLAFSSFWTHHSSRESISPIS